MILRGFLLLVATVLLTACTAEAQDACETALVGHSYSCTFETIVTGPFAVVATFANPTAPEVLTSFQGSFASVVVACSCATKGKPGKLKSSAKSTEVFCGEAQASPLVNDEFFIFKTNSRGSKIVRGRYYRNDLATTGVFTCTQN